jgi:hypothetical protein
VSASLQTVHVRVNDAASGKPTPVRLRIASTMNGQEVEHTPLGRLAAASTAWGQHVGGSVVLEGRTWHYIDGQCEVPLPAGPLSISISKGPAYLPVEEVVERKPGQISLRFAIRPREPQVPGWHAADCRAHFLSPHAACLEGAAEGLDLVNVLAAEWGEHEDRFHANVLEFSGQASALMQHGCQVAVNTYNRGGAKGDLALLHCHRIVHPLSISPLPRLRGRGVGREGDDLFADYNILDWCGQCHRKGGLVIWPNFEKPEGERLAALQAGQIDAVEWSPAVDPEAMLKHWYELLNAGRRVPLVGASGKASNAECLGAIRTYTRLEEGEAFTLDNWVKAVKAGRTVASRGPLVQLDMAGETAAASGQHMRPGDTLCIIHNGAVAARASADAQGRAEVTTPVPSTGWVAARCERGGRLQAHRGADSLHSEGVNSGE